MKVRFERPTPNAVKAAACKPGTVLKIRATDGDTGIGIVGGNGHMTVLFNDSYGDVDLAGSEVEGHLLQPGERCVIAGGDE